MPRTTIIALALALHVGAQTPWLDNAVPSKSERVAILKDKRIHESSGLCLSASDPDVFWTHNDSGGEPCVFAIDRSGNTRAKVRIPNAANFDWEDITRGKDAQGVSQLFIGDIGDNFKVRFSIQVYQITEPAIAPSGTAIKETISAAPLIWRGHYPDGKHNAESLLVHPTTRRLYIITKSDDGKCALYAFPEKLQTGKSMTLEKIAPLTFPPLIRIGKRPQDNCMTTAADFSPDGSRLVVATYSSLYEWKLPKKSSLVEALKQPPVRIQPDLFPQVEGACYDADGQTIWLTSERLPTPLVRVTR